MTTFILQPLATCTLSHKPSWQNRNGKIDRSACFELRASSLWRHADFTEYKKGKREAASDITITARFLIQLADKHHPHQLQGDNRTSKTNVFKDRFQESGVGSQGLTPTPLKGGGWGVGVEIPVANPNKGATRTKMLGLWESWRQTVVIERWRLHKNLAQHFLICPTCNNKSLKLFLPLCTKQEMQDADIAEAWLKQLDVHQQIKRTPLLPAIITHRAKLINRYGILFRDERKLVCSKCLGLRYGQVRK